MKAVPAAQRISAEEIRSMLEEVGDLVRLVGEAGAEDKAALYTQLGLKLTYYPGQQYVEARIEPEPPQCACGVCPRVDTNHIPTDPDLPERWGCEVRPDRWNRRTVAASLASLSATLLPLSRL
ncbi:hypothetical protein ACFWY5_11385 [Nonomuraea sp. NPDC059007]|uniref:hypothetical protein n=1 Tax=Nonomuraea sp. NPDC059007 TaxID=3346692 RepID=UPI0036A3D210